MKNELRVSCVERRDGVPGEPLEERQWHDSGPETVPTEPHSCDKIWVLV